LVPARTDTVGQILTRAGFAVQLPAHLPLLLSVMTGVRAAEFAGPVVNCSYPDLTHQILDRMGLAPTVGVGNVAMIQLRIRRAMRRGNAAPTIDPVLRVVAHHAHVVGVMRGSPDESSATRPRIYLGEDGDRQDRLAYQGGAVPVDRGLNLLTAVSALPVLRALLPAGRPVRTSVPGPGGRPGGYPVVIRPNRVDLDLPPGVDLTQTVAHQQQAAREDGVDGVDADGTVHFTADARSVVGRLDPALASPLHPDELTERFNRLAEILRR